MLTPTMASSIVLAWPAVIPGSARACGTSFIASLHQSAGRIEDVQLAGLAAQADPLADAELRRMRHHAAHVRSALDQMGEELGAHRLEDGHLRMQGGGNIRP